MSISEPFIKRPVATTLLTVAVALAGAVAFDVLPVAPLPEVDFPTISVSASLPGASAEIMASSVATPLERQFAHIASVTEMTSSSTLGSTSVTLQFDLDRDIDGAARDVEAGINAARTYLPTNLPQNPSYRKINPADAPIMIMSLTSAKYEATKLYDLASTILEQKLSQIGGVGQVTVGGGAAPAVRVEADPVKLESFGLTLGNVSSVLGLQNALLPRGQIANGAMTADILTNDQISQAAQYKPLVVGYNNGSAVHLSDVATVVDSTQNLRTAGYTDGVPSITVIIFRQPGANIINTVENIETQLPFLRAVLPQGVNFTIVLDRTTTIRASVRDVEITLLISVCLVAIVVFVFLRNARATLIPVIAVPVSLIGTFAAMYAFGFTLDNLSLMALTIATGFVVDDAIVVMENISRHLAAGMHPLAAALQGAQEIGFTVLSISISLIAVFIPILLMGGIVGRLFREFAITLSGAIVISMAISLTTTPTLCAYFLKPEKEGQHNRAYRISEQFFDGMLSVYSRTLRVVLDHPLPMLLVLALTIALNFALIVKIPKGFFPQQDTGAITGGVQGPQDASFPFINYSLLQMVKIIKADPAVQDVNANTGGSGATNSGSLYIALKPLNERKISAAQVIDRLRPQLNRLPIASLFLQAVQDIRVGGRASNALYQYTIQADNVSDLSHWGPLLLANMKKLAGFQDVNTDQQNGGLQEYVTYDRVTAARLGQTVQSLDSLLYSAFGQSEVSVIYTPLNQYYVVLEAAPSYWQSPEGLNALYFNSNTSASSAGAASANTMAPLFTVATTQAGTTPLAVNHTGVFPSVTVSFNLAPNVSLSQATSAIGTLERQLGMPTTITGFFAGTLEAYQESLASEPLLVAAALLAVYIVLGILYESLIHPLTIISTLPSASVGAMLALMLFHIDLNVMSIIGIVLLIGIVKKNAIMMIDFALDAAREGKNTYDAIFEACMLRFRPIMMTTVAAMFGALPLAFGTGMGSELRRPLGITIVGGLLLSQLITLYSTPVVYLELDRLRLRLAGKHQDAPRPETQGAGS